MSDKNAQLATLQEIKTIMNKSGRFLSLSGLSGMAAGICALIGGAIAAYTLSTYELKWQSYYPEDLRKGDLILRLMLIGIGTLAFAFASAYYFTYRKAAKEGARVWNNNSVRLLWQVAYPLLVGGIISLRLIFSGGLIYIAPLCLIFYGWALNNAAKHTHSEIKYLGYIHIILGLINLWLPFNGLIFFILGFGVAHIIYGYIMYNKYDKKG
jgi:hypothetical protein